MYILYAVNFFSGKAKNVGEAGLRRGFLTPHEEKLTSRKWIFIIESFLRDGYTFLGQNTPL